MNYDEITKITAEHIENYMTQAINAKSTGVAELFHNAAWGVHTLWFELASKIERDTIKENRYTYNEIKDKFERQNEEFRQRTERERVPLLKSSE